MNRSYDHRREKRYDEERRSRTRQDRDRSRSRSPDERTTSEKDKMEQARKARMSRLRAENEQEERQLAAALEQQEQHENETEKKGPQESIIQVNAEELEGMDEEDQMKALLGFGGGFGSTKGQKVDDNHKSSAKGAVSKNKARKYRQYMNRKNGFNRPLDKMD